MSSDKRLQTAVRLGLGMGASAMALGYAPGALAQDTSEADEVLEEIVTTGTRIKRADLDSAAPVTVLDRQDIISQGITDVGSIIQRMPSMAGTPLGTTTNNGNNSTGLVQVDLRGMGTNRTVMLVNGQRTVDGGDYTTIPSAMIERVEILKDGASAVYGADAIAGVVNIITRRDFEGVEVEAQTNAWFNTDNGEQTTFSLIAGKNFGDGHFVFGAEYVDQQEAFQRDVPWGYMQSSYYIFEPGCEARGGDTTECDFFGSSRIPESRIQFSTPGGLESTNPDGASAIFMIENPGDVMTPYDGRTYNYAPVNYMQTPYDRLNYFAEGSFEVSDTIMFNASVRGMDRTTEQELAPLPYDSNIYPSFSGSFNGAAYNGVSPDNYYVVQGIAAYNAANGTNFAPEPVTNVRRRMVETPRHYEQDVAQWDAVFSFEGQLGNDMDWEVFYNRGKRTVGTYQTGQFSGVRLTGALGPSQDLDGDGNPECYTDNADPGSLIVGCVPMNFWAGEGAVTDEMIDYVEVKRNDTRISEQEIAGFALTGGGWELGGGEFGWAVGGGYWGQSYVYTPDSAAAIGAITGGTGTGTDGSLYNKNLFGEIYLPFFDNGSQSLSVSAGARYDDYNVFGDDTTYQLGIEFGVIESLKLRATAGTAFRAPSISELFGGLTRSAPTYSDPCDVDDYAEMGGDGTNIAPGCPREAVRTDTQTTSFVGGNQNLAPETADTLTAGFVFTPDIGDGALSLTVDYWRIEMEDAINSLGVRYILDQCYVEQNATECAKISRRDDVDYTIRQILDNQQNVAENYGEGVDAEIRYSFGTGIGDFDLSLLWAHLLERSRVPLPGDPTDDQTGLHVDRTACDTCGTFAEDKFNFSARWMMGDLTVSYLAEYIGSIDADAQYIDYRYSIDAQMYHDIVVDYTLDAFGQTRITAGVTNLTDEAPPFIDQGFNASTDPNTYRVFGMGWFLRLTQTF